MPQPHFIIKNKFQKRSELYENILTDDILSDVCRRITGRSSYTVDFDNTGYNKGRLATLEYQGSISYISFSEFEIKSRNSFFQSFPSALVKYHQEDKRNKGIYFYFLPPDGNIETSYFIFMYRVMKTAGTIFLNESDYLTTEIISFNSVADIIAQRDLNRDRNRSNNSTYLTLDEDNTVQIYGKTYGASKFETTLFCLAIFNITKNKIELFEIPEGNLKRLPKAAREVIESLHITIINSDLTLERGEFDTNDSLRSPIFMYNLFAKLGDKKCALCECKIPQIIQGAHIWPVAEIKKEKNINHNHKFQLALDGDNGIWLCNNHHKLFDINLLLIKLNGRLKYKSNINELYKRYICDVTVNTQIHQVVMTRKFKSYLSRRNKSLNESAYSFIE